MLPILGIKKTFIDPVLLVLKLSSDIIDKRRIDNHELDPGNSGIGGILPAQKFYSLLARVTAT
jgi:hypothetical protein